MPEQKTLVSVIMSLAINAKRKGQWIGKIFPSGDFTIGKNQPLKTDKGSHPLEGIGSHTTFYGSRKVSVPDRDLHKDFDTKVLEKISIAYQDAGNQELADRFGDRYAFEVLNPPDRAENIELPKSIEANNQDCYGDDWSGMRVSALGLSDAINSHKSPVKKLKRGSKGVSSYGKRCVRSGLTLLEKRFGRGCISFGTATLPPMEAHELEKICLDWSNITRKFFQELTRLLDRRGLSKDFVQVTEIQEKRFLVWGQVCPHLHWVMQGKLSTRSHWLILPDEIRSLWERILSNCLGREVDGKAATRIEKPRKSLAVELGKYMSKGGKIIKQILDSDHAHLLPTSYWGCSNALKKEIKSGIKIMVGDECEAFIDSLDSLKEQGLASYIHILKEIDEGFTICIGFCGWVRDSVYSSLSIAA